MTRYVPLRTGRTAFQQLRRARALASLSLAAVVLPMLPRPAFADSSPTNVPPSQPGQANLTSTDAATASVSGFSSATVDPATGVLRTSISFALPRARGAVQPQLALNYSSSGGVGVGGRGWSLGIASIERHNPSGAPQFNDPPATATLPQPMDLFTYAGEPLVMICRIEAGGVCASQGGKGPNQLIAGEKLPSFATVGGWYYYRLQTEKGSLLRFFWSADHTRWVVQDKSGAMSEYGVPSGGSDTTSTDRDDFGNIFRWNLFTQYDTERTTAAAPANRIVYAWKQQHPGLRGTSLGYLTDIYDTPPPGNSAPTPATYAHHTHLLYTTPASTAWTSSTTAPIWLAHPTFVLSGVDVTSQDFAAAGPRQQLRRYFLAYQAAKDGPLAVGSVQLEGNCAAAQNNAEDPTTFLLPAPTAGSTCVQQQTRPPTTFTYRSTSSDPFPVAMPPITDGTKSPLLFDLNADGLPDFIDVTAPSPVVWMNSLTTPNTFTSQPISLGNTKTLNLSNLNQLGTGLSFGVGAFQMDGRLDMLWNTEAEWHGANGIGGATPVPLSACPTPNEALYCDPSMSYALLNASENSSGAWTLTPTLTGTFTLGADYPAFSSYVKEANGQAWACSTPPCLEGGEQTIGTIDMNGDGLADLLNIINYDNPAAVGSADYVPSWWQYTIRFSKRSADGTYWPFYGASSPQAVAGVRTDVCLGGVDPSDQDDPYVSWVEGHVVTTQNVFADVDGDGIIDMVQGGTGGQGGTAGLTPAWWPGHGDGVFGACPDGSLQCSCAVATPATLNLVLPTDPLLVWGVHDVTGDGLVDVVASNKNGGGILIYEGLGGTPLQFAAPYAEEVGGNLGFATEPTAIYFADMNGNGIDDVILQAPKAGGSSAATALGFVDLHGVGSGPNTAPDTTSIREGALTDIDNGLGAHVHATYDSVADLARQAASAGTPWTSSLPTPTHVVTSLTTSDSTGDSYATSYTYSNPVFDGRDHEFLGFQKVRQTSPGNAATLMNTETTYFDAACGPAQPVACAAETDYNLASYRGLPTLVEVFDGSSVHVSDLTSAVYLSTTHHSYATKVLYSGSDGRQVRRIYDAKADTFLYDTSPFTARTQLMSIPDVDISAYPVGFTTRGSFAQQIERTQTLDAFGNVQTSTDLGNVATLTSTGATRSPDPAIQHSTTWAVSTNTDSANEWIWRAQSAETLDPASGASRVFTQQYDVYGNMTDVYATLSGTQPLARPTSGAAPLPTGASKDGTVHVEHVTYDPVGTGNPTTVTKYPSSTAGSTAGRCTEYSYDAAYAQLLTTESVDVGGCGSASKMVTQHGWDRVLGLELFTVAPNGARSARTYDGLGRVTSSSKPDQVTSGFSDVETTVTYKDTSYGQLIHTSQVGGAQNGSDGTAGSTYAPLDTFVFNDALGRTLQVVSSGDTQSQWVLSGQVTRDVRGRVTATFVPTFVSVSAGADGSSIPIAAPTSASRTTTYDAFNRPTQTADIDGTVTSRTSYHALSVDTYDAENLRSGSPHAGAYATSTQDGHGRTIAVAALGNGGLITTQATYQATGEVTSISRSGKDANGGVSFARYMQYDSLGRLVINAEPNSSQNYAPVTRPGSGPQQVWTYAYDDLGELVATSDSRGCGENVAYDGAGRILSEDYSPCNSTTQAPYTSPSTTAGDGDGTEAYYVYEGGALASGFLSDVYDRASHEHFTHDPRGRVTEIDRQIANPGTPPSALASRYSPTVSTMQIGYDDRDRIATQSTGADVAQLQSTNATYAPHFGPSTVGMTYSTRGNMQSVEGSYGKLVAGAVFEADGRPDSVSYADAAQTTLAYTYGDSRRRLTGLEVSRAGSFPAATKTYSPPAASRQQRAADAADHSYERHDRLRLRR